LSLAGVSFKAPSALPKSAPAAAFIAELASLLVQAQSVQPVSGSPAVLNFVVSTLAAARSAASTLDEAQALNDVAAAFVSALRAIISAKFDNQAIIQLVAFDAVANSIATHLALNRTPKNGTREPTTISFSSAHLPYLYY
jgi:hypothetical protein